MNASTDGARVPMFLSARRGVQPGGNRPTILYGYGGFNICIQPLCSPAIAAWLEHGGVYVVANLRGGGQAARGSAQQADSDSDRDARGAAAGAGQADDATDQ